MGILILAACALLWRLGGWDKAKWSGYRDVLIPIILGLYYAITLTWWIGLITCAAFNIIRMGYGAYDPEHDDKPSLLAKITKDRQGFIVRGLYGVVTSAVGGLGVAIYTRHFGLFLLYILGNAILEVVLNLIKARDIVVEPLNGAGRACLIYVG